jgi:hypothetical protein
VATPRLPGQTPAGVNVRATPGPSSLPFAPPSATADGGEPAAGRGPADLLARTGIDPSISLGDFQASYTSEDNASFEALVVKLNKQHRRRYHWLYDPTQMQVVLAGPAVPELASATTAAAAAGGEGALVPAAAAGAVVAVPAVAPAAAAEDPEAPRAPRPLKFWPHRVRNDLMFYPEGLPETSADRIAASRTRPSINYAAVRFSRHPFGRRRSGGGWCGHALVGAGAARH